MSSTVTTNIDGFHETLSQMCKEVVEQDVEALRKNVRSACRVTTSELHKTSPKQTSGSHAGQYARGWRSKTEVGGDGHITGTVYNATDYQLTHLLEKGHELFYLGVDTGHRTRAYPHIEPAYETGKQELLGGA